MYIYICCFENNFMVHPTCIDTEHLRYENLHMSEQSHGKQLFDMHLPSHKNRLKYHQKGRFIHNFKCAKRLREPRHFELYPSTTRNFCKFDRILVA